MRYVIKIALYTILLFLAIGSGISGFADEEETRQKQKDQVHLLEETVAEEAAIGDRFKTYFSISATEGYDNNVFLDSSRKGDAFDQIMGDLIARYRLNKQVDIKARYDFTSITYHEATDLSMIDNDGVLSLEYYPMNNVRIEAGYEADLLTYLKNKDGDLIKEGPFCAIRHYFNPKTYIGAKYQYSSYDYEHRNIRGGAGNRLPLTRKDHRHNAIAEIITHIKKLFLKIKATYYFNESNDEYMDYYDYWSGKINLYTAYPVTQKMSILFNGGYQYKDYESRTITTSVDKKESDDLMILGGGLFYKITPSFYINTNYTYRQNYSNDPFQEYSGSVGTVGFNYLF